MLDYLVMILTVSSFIGRWPKLFQEWHEWANYFPFPFLIHAHVTQFRKSGNTLKYESSKFREALRQTSSYTEERSLQREEVDAFNRRAHKQAHLVPDINSQH